MLEGALGGRGIDKASPVPYYYQIAGLLREAIEDMRAAAGPDEGEIPLPSEPALAEHFDVTRGTIRHALAILEREGLIYREKGRGTFVRRRRVELDLTTLGSITEDMARHGWTPSYRLLGIEATEPGSRAQAALGLEAGESAWRIHRLRLADGEPVCVEESFIPQRLAPDLDRQDLTGSLYGLLQSRYGFHLQAAEQTIRIRTADPEEARLLDSAEGAAVFVITGVIRDAGGNPVEYSHSVWRGDRYDLQVRLLSRE
ncbi:MAG: GntR family transcriptional regulator [Armatimonadota bacterium]